MTPPCDTVWSEPALHHGEHAPVPGAFTSRMAPVSPGQPVRVRTCGGRSPARGNRPTGHGQPQRLQGVGTFWCETAVGRATVIADGGYRGTGLLIPHRHERGQTELPAWKEEHNTSHRKVRARVEHAFARMKAWKIPRDCRLKGDGVHTAMLGIARLHNLALTG